MTKTIYLLIFQAREEATKKNKIRSNEYQMNIFLAYISNNTQTLKSQYHLLAFYLSCKGFAQIKEEEKRKTAGNLLLERFIVC